MTFAIFRLARFFSEACSHLLGNTLMLDLIRNRAQGWIAGTIVAILSLAFALFGVQYYLTSHAGGNVVAKINGTSITSSQVDRLYGQMRRQLMAQMGGTFPSDQNFQKSLKQQALRSLIDRTIVSHAAKEAGYSINPEQVVAEIRGNAAFQVDGQFSPTRFHQLIQNIGYGEQEFTSNYAQSMITGQIQMGIEGSAFALENEIAQAVRLSEQKRSFNHLEIPLKQFLSSVKVSDEEAKTYYNNHLDQFQDPMKIRVNYVELSVDAFKQKVKPTEEQIKTFYSENIKRFSSPKQWHLERWQVALDPAATAQDVKNATDQLQAIKDGNKATKLVSKKEWVSADPINMQIIKHISQSKTGEFSEPYRTVDGMEVVKVLAVKAEVAKPFDTVKNDVAKAWVKHEIEHVFVEQSEQLSELSYTNPDSLAPIADTLGLKIQTSDYFSAAGSETGLASEPKVIKAAFNEDVLNDNNNSGPIEIGAGHLVVLRLKDKIPVKPKEFASVKGEIVKSLQQEKASQKIAELGNSLLNDLRAKKDVTKVLAANNLKWQTHKEVARHENELSADIIRTAFGIPDPKFLNNAAAVAGKQTSKGDYILVQLEKIHQLEEHKLSSQQQNVFGEAIAAGFGKLEFELYLKSLKDGVSIEIMKQR